MLYFFTVNGRAFNKYSKFDLIVETAVLHLSALHVLMWSWTAAMNALNDMKFVCLFVFFYSVNQIKYKTILSYKIYKRERLKRYR